MPGFNTTRMRYFLLLCTALLSICSWSILSLLPGKTSHTLDNVAAADFNGSTVASAIFDSRRPSRISGLRRMPRILHQAFSTALVAKEYEKLIESCLALNPDWEYYLWRDEDIEQFVRRHFPQHLINYRRFGMREQRSDIVKYMVLYKYGGVFLDMDVQCVRPFLPHLPTAAGRGKAFLDQERREQARIVYNRAFTAMNSAMGGRPGHPFFLAMLSAMYSVPPGLAGVGWTTGVELLTSLYAVWVRSANQSVDPVTLLDPVVFSPALDTRLHNFSQLCRRASEMSQLSWRNEGCRELQAGGAWSEMKDISQSDSTIGRHLFLRLGYDWGPTPSGTFNLASVHPRLKMYARDRMRLPSLK